MTLEHKKIRWWTFLILALSICLGVLAVNLPKPVPEDPAVLTGLPTTQKVMTPAGTFPTTWTPSPSPVPTATRTPLPSSTPTISLTLPVKILIEGVVGHSQELPLDCEAAAAVVWARFFGFKIDELEFFAKIPKSDNPNKGFVGDVESKWGSLPPEAYGVHAAPVAMLLRKYGVPALEVYEFPWESLQRELAKGNPVLVWIVGHVNKGKSINWRSSDGVVTVIAPYEHTVIIIGYDDKNVKILDGENIYTRTVEQFLDSWEVLGYMGIIKFP